jgi:hypothetical protein
MDSRPQARLLAMMSVMGMFQQSIPDSPAC